MAHVHEPGKQHSNGQPKPGQPRGPLAGASSKPAASSSITEHAKELMDRLIPLMPGITPEGIALRAFELARAFAAEATKSTQTGATSDG